MLFTAHVRELWAPLPYPVALLLYVVGPLVVSVPLSRSYSPLSHTLPRFHPHHPSSLSRRYHHQTCVLAPRYYHQDVEM